MADLLKSLQGFISPDLISRTSSELGENEPATAKAFGGIVPTVLGGLVHRASEPGGLGSIFNKVQNSDRGLLSNISSTVPGAPGSTVPAGDQFLHEIFGNNLEGISNTLSNYAGIKSSSVSAILGYIAPLVLGFLGKKTHDEELDEEGLSSYLSNQKASIMSALPARLGGELGLGGLGSAAATAVPPMERSSQAAAAERGHQKPIPTGRTNWLWPLLGIVALLLLVFGLRNCNEDKETEDKETEAVITEPARTQGKRMEPRQPDVALTEREIPGGVVLNIPPNGIESKLVAFIEDKNKMPDKTSWFSFDRLHFETGSAQIKPESQEQIDNIAKILKAYPQVHIKIGGYTDNIGQPASNLKLSQSRAEAVKNAIQQQGIDASRLEAEGYGEQHPVADNATEEGRAQNRRIDVLVTRK